MSWTVSVNYGGNPKGAITLNGSYNDGVGTACSFSSSYNKDDTANRADFVSKCQDKLTEQKERNTSFGAIKTELESDLNS